MTLNLIGSVVAIGIGIVLAVCYPAMSNENVSLAAGLLTIAVGAFLLIRGLHTIMKDEDGPIGYAILSMAMIMVVIGFGTMSTPSENTMMSVGITLAIAGGLYLLLQSFCYPELFGLNSFPKLRKQHKKV